MSDFAKGTNVPTNDLISRQEVLKYKCDCYDSEGHLLYAVPTGHVIRLPSAQSEIIKCKDCKHWINHHLCESLSRYGTFETKDEFFCGYAERKSNE